MERARRVLAFEGVVLKGGAGIGFSKGGFAHLGRVSWKDELSQHICYMAE